ncbi:MAG: hypothetical protein OEU92_31865 [Alphaproteobacteria bacterium]|nr:hypothetical protein [Alphaproteobacteria bacterium]
MIQEAYMRACFEALRLAVEARDVFFNDDRLGIRGRAECLKRAYPMAPTKGVLEMIDRERMHFSTVKRRAA